MSDVTLLTELRYLDLDASHWYHQQIALEEGLLIDALDTLGIRAARRAWDDPLMDWRSAGALVFRSTWNYFDAMALFRPWLSEVTRSCRLINSGALIEWNMDKHYLADLGARGVAVVPTVYVSPTAPRPLAEILEANDWHDVVIKPAVGGAARLTWRGGMASLAADEAELARCLTQEAMLVQPFQRAIQSTGEVSVVVIDDHVCHAVRKRARSGDFRVQDDHGGTVHPHEATKAERRLALAAVAACPEPPRYARVDMLDGPDGPQLMEIELIEPELFLRYQPSSAMALARAIGRSLS